jgi:hypothetical protein
MRITTIEELAAYLRAEIVRLQTELATVADSDGGDVASSLHRVHVDGELAAVQKALAMVSDDAFADGERDRARSDERLLAGAVDPYGEQGGTDWATAGVAAEVPWPGGADATSAPEPERPHAAR